MIILVSCNAVIDSNSRSSDGARNCIVGSKSMATLTIRNLDPSVKERLRVRAAQNGRSMEAELRALIADAVETASPPPLNLADAIRRRFAPLGGVELKLSRRQPMREPPTFE